MPMKQIDGYDIEYMAEPLEGCAQWGAYVTIYAPSATPMHMNILYAKHRVAADQVLASEEEAERAAQASALEILEHLRHPPAAPAA